MARKCSLTGKAVMVGNNVSHSNRKTRRRFLPNLMVASFFSDRLGKSFSLRVSANAIRTVDHNGGIDSYLLSVADEGLSRDALRIKKQLKKLAA